MIEEDSQFNSLDWWVNKLELAEETLKKAFDFDDFILEVDELIDISQYISLVFIDNKKNGWCIKKYAKKKQVEF